MNILLLTQVLPYPPDSGPKIKTWNLIKYLSRRHNITLVSFVRGDQSDDAHHLERYCQAVHVVPMKRGFLRDMLAILLSFLTGKPFLMIRDDRVEMRQLIRELVEESCFEAVHADQLNMAQYAARVPTAQKVLDTHNTLWLLYKRLWQTMGAGPKKWVLGREWRLLKRYEGQVCPPFDALLAVSEEDKAALSEAIGEPKDIMVLPIALDLEEVTVVPRSPNANHVLYIGTMFWPPNSDGVMWFLHRVWPLIRAQRPDAFFDIVGARPPKGIARFNSGPFGVNVKGYVEDPTPFLKHAAVMVVPLRAGGGMRVKILTALGNGLPVVTSSIGCEGIEVEDGRHLLIADTAIDFARSTLRVLDNPELGHTLGCNGRELIESMYDYREAYKPLGMIY